MGETTFALRVYNGILLLNKEKRVIAKLAVTLLNYRTLGLKIAVRIRIWAPFQLQTKIAGK